MIVFPTGEHKEQRAQTHREPSDSEKQIPDARSAFLFQRVRFYLRHLNLDTVYEVHVIKIQTSNILYLNIFKRSIEARRSTNHESLWPILQPTTRGPKRYFGFTFGGAAMSSIFYLQPDSWRHRDEIISTVDFKEWEEPDNVVPPTYRSSAIGFTERDGEER